MSDGRPQTPKEPSEALLKAPKNWLKRTFSSRSTSPQPSADGQDNRGGELSSAQHATVESSEHQWILVDPVIGASAALCQQDHRTLPQLSRSQPSPSLGPPGSAVAHDQRNTLTQDGAVSVGPTQPHGTAGDLSETQAHPKKSTRRALSTAKDIRSFTEMLLKRLPDALDTNPAKVAFGIVKIVLQIKDEVKGNIDAVDQRILSTVDQLRTVEKALAGWQPNNPEEKRGIELYKMTLVKEWTNLIELKKQSLIRKIAVHEEDKGKIADIFERINRAREQLVVVTGLRVHKTVLAIQEDVAKLLLERLEASHAADHKSELEGEQRQVLRRAVCTPGTRVRILRDITKWANDTSSESQSVYWLSGQAGSGKSTIAYTIARRFEFAGDADDAIVLGGNFFCSRQIKETRSATRIVRTIVYHLALKSKAFADALRASGKFDTIHHGVRSQLENLLIEPWKQAQSADPSKSLQFLVVIDALDEIDGKDGSGFLRDLLDSINKHRLQGLKFFATSRPDPDIVTHLKSFKNKQFYRLAEVPIEEAQADIMTYLNANLGYSIGRPEIEKIASQAAGLFIYAATVVKYVEGYASAEHEERLSTLFVENPEETLLDSLYHQVLLDAQHRFKSQHYLDILHTFLCTAERTSTSVVAKLLLPPNKTNPTLSHTEIAHGVLKSLYAVLYIENDKVLTYHKSFTDFMFDQNRAKKFWCDRAKRHRLLTSSCFRIMDNLKFNIANIKSSFLLDRDNCALPNAVKQKITPVLSYSCRNWDYHLSAIASTDSDALCDTLSHFLQLRVLFWIEAMNLLGSRGQCDRMLQRARKWVPNDNLTLRKDFAEAASFALYFSGSEAALSTPHLYISALATWLQDLGPCRGWKRHFPRIPEFTNASLGDRPLMTLGVGSSVQAVAFSSDDSRIVSGSEDKLVRVWDASTGEMLEMLEGHTDCVKSVAFSSDDSRIISGSVDTSVRVWDALTGMMLKVLEGHTRSVLSVAFSSDDSRIISGSVDNSVRVWDASTGKTLKMLEGHTNHVRSVAFSSDDSRIVSGSVDKSVRVWDALTGKTLKVLEGHTNHVNSVAFSSDNSHIVSGSSDKSVRVWDALTGETLKVLEHTRQVWSVAFSSDDNHIVSGSYDKSVRVWDASTGEMLKVLEGHSNSVWSVAFSSDVSRIVSGSRDKSVRVWDALMGETLKVLEGHTDCVKSVAFSSDDSRIISGSDDKSVRVWDASTGKMLRVLKGHTYSVCSVAFSNDDTRIISGSDDKSVRVWDASTGETLKVLEGHTYSVTSVAFSSDDSRIVSGSVDLSVRVWDALTGNMLKVLEGHTQYVRSVAFSSDDSHVISGSDDKSVRVWDASTGEALKVLEGHTEFVRSVAFSSNDSHIVSGSDDNSVRVWDASTGEMLKVLEGHTYSVTSVAFSSDDSRIVSGSSDLSVRVWDALTGETLKVLEGHTDYVWSVAFSSDDSCIVSGSYDKSVRLWDASTGETLKVLEDHAEPAAFSVNGRCAAADLYDKPLPTLWTSLRYIRQKIADSSGYPRHTGWLLSPQGEHYLMFVPLTAQLPDSSNILTLPQSYAPSVDFTSSALGSKWYKCFSS